MTKKYGNNLYLTDLSNISKEIYQIGLRRQMQLMKLKTPGNSKNPTNLTKLFYLTYQTGARIGELIRDPYPKMTVANYKKWTIMHVDKINEKHWKEKKHLDQITGKIDRYGNNIKKTDFENSVREWMPQNIPIDDVSDKLMWDFITDDGGSLNNTWLKDYTYSQRQSLHHRFAYSFRARLTDGSITKVRGITPHILRHLRAYNLLFNKGYEMSFIQAFFGWTKAQMLTDHYVYIKNALKNREQMQILERMLDGRKGQSITEYALGSGELNVVT